jgi:DinB superfamily
MQSETLIQNLWAQTEEIIGRAKALQSLDLGVLCWKDNETSWHILECVAHLKLYNDFYLPKIAAEIKHSNSHFEAQFKSGFLGRYFVKMISPKAKPNKMKTAKDKNPLNQSMDKNMIESFVHKQLTLLDLLQQAKLVSLQQIKIPTSISRFIRLNLGDTFQFLINHQLRHFKQIDDILLRQKHSV